MGWGVKDKEVDFVRTTQVALHAGRVWAASTDGFNFNTCTFFTDHSSAYHLPTPDGPNAAALLIKTKESITPTTETSTPHRRLGTF